MLLTTAAFTTAGFVSTSQYFKANLLSSCWFSYGPVASLESLHSMFENESAKFLNAHYALYFR
jgi:hypothetical protein